MKKSIIFHVLLVGSLLLGGCYQKEVTCVTLPKSQLLFISNNSYSPMSYDGYRIDAYKPKSDFGHLDFSVVKGPFDRKGGNIVTLNDSSFAGLDKHDWIITFYPSARQFKITDVVRGMRTETMAKIHVSEGIECYNGYSFSLDGVPCTSVNLNTSYRPAYEDVKIYVSPF